MGHKYLHENHAFGYFLEPNLVREHMDDITKLPLSKPEAIKWLFDSNLLPGELKGKFKGSAEVLRGICSRHPRVFLSSLSALLSSSGPQSDYVNKYISEVKEEARNLSKDQLLSISALPTTEITEELES